MLTTFAPLSAAYLSARAMSSSDPPVSDAAPNTTSHTLASALSGISFTLNATPAVPMLSFVN